MEELHVHKFTETVVPPTCKENGYTSYTCECGYEHKANFKPAVPHDFQPTEETPAGCTEPGSKKYVCTYCGETKEEAVPPLGHDFKEQVVQTYPTCDTPGVQLRKCCRCAAVEEHEMKPTGHRCAPGSARRVQGNMEEFFCENCGQTVSRLVPVSPKPEKRKFYWPTRLMLTFALLATLLSLGLELLLELLPNTSYSSPIMVFSGTGLQVLWLGIILLCAGCIKRNPRYSRWMGVATLFCVGYKSASLINTICFYITRPDFKHWTDYLLEWSLSAAMIVFGLFLTVLFFTGAKKRLLPAVVALLYIMFDNGVDLLGTFSYVSFAVKRLIQDQDWFYGLNALISSVGFFAQLFVFISLLMLIWPHKKPRVTEEITFEN